MTCCCWSSSATCGRRKNSELSDPQKNLAAIEEVRNRDDQRETYGRCRKVRRPSGQVSVEKIADIPAHEPARDLLEVDETVDEIERDGVGAEPHENRAPPLLVPVVDHFIERAEQQQAESARDQDER